MVTKKITVFANGFGYPRQREVLLKLIEHFNIGTCYGVNYDESANANKQLQLFKFEDLVFANYHNLEQAIPLDSHLISEMYECESIVLKMMDRVTPTKWLNYDDRKNMYLKHLRFWNDFIVKNNLSCFLSTNIPHEIFDYVAMSLCKYYKIPTIFSYQHNLIDVFFMLNDLTKFVPKIEQDYRKLQADSDNKMDKKLSPKFEQHYQNKLQAPFYMKDAAKQVSALTRLTTSVPGAMLKYSSFFLRKERISRIRSHVESSLLTRAMLRFYDENSEDADFSKKYVYFPLHYQPEMTTCPMAGVFVDQHLIVDMLVSFLPEDVFIYVKEHPKQSLVSRNINFYRELIKNKRVKLIKKGCSSFDLIKNSVAVATGTGTAGWEAITIQKPVFLFGFNYFEAIDGMFRIYTNEDCKKAVESVFLKNYAINPDDIRLFLKAIEMNSYDGYSDYMYKTISTLSEEDNKNNLFLAFRYEIEKYV